MARALVLGNGHLTACFDSDGNLRDLYYPYVGLENHVGGYHHRIGIWWDGNFSWLSSVDWTVKIDMVNRSMLGQILYEHKTNGLRVIVKCVVYNELPILIRAVTFVNTKRQAKIVKVFFGQEFAISETKFRNTGFYDPTKNAIIHYKGRRVFMVNGQSETNGIYEYTIGMFDYAGMRGSYVDAEDGILSNNAVEHGPVDSVMSFYADLTNRDSADFYSWICASHSIDEVYKLNQVVLEKTPHGMIHSTTSFWQAWTEAIPREFYGLSDLVVQTYYNSLFILRAHLDHKGGILASLDSDMLVYGKDSYAYVWPRDAAFVAITLDKAGYQGITKKFYEFCEQVMHADGYLHHKFQPDMSLGSTWQSSIKQKDWLKNKILQMPIQEDETATVIFGLWEHYKVSNDIEYIESIYKPFIEKAADFMIEFRDKYTKLPIQSYDLWEEISGVSTYTCCAVVGGLRAAAKFASVLGKYNHAHTCEETADELIGAMRNYLFNKDLNSFVRGIQVEGIAVKKLNVIDASSLFGLWYYSVLPEDDPMYIGTLEAVEKYLHLRDGIGGFVRYQNDLYHKDNSVGTPNPWIVTTMWELQRKVVSAKNVYDLKMLSGEFDWVTDRLKVFPVMAEQYHPITGAPLSATPLAWSHSIFVETVLAYINKMADFVKTDIIMK